MKHLATCFGLLHGKIYKFEALELTVDLLHGLRTSVCPSFGEHFGFSSTKGVMLSRLVTGLVEKCLNSKSL